MNIRITSRKFKAKDSLKDFIKQEVKSLEKFNDQIMNCNVILSYTHPKDSIKTAEIIVNIPSHTITVSVSSSEFEKSVTIAVDKLIKQLSKTKSKIRSKKRSLPRKINED